MNDPISYKTAVAALRERFPEFVASSEKWYDDLPYDAFGTFALFLCRCIDQGCSGALVSRAFEFFNEMAGSGDDEVVNLLEVAALEIVADHSECARIAERRLNDTGRRLLRRVQRGGFADA
jgi:hypothetical protein